MSKIAIGTGLGHGSDVSWLGAEGVPPPPPFQAALNTSAGTIVLTPGPTSVTVSITDSPSFDGTYQAQIADLLMGPVNLAPPVITGTGITESELVAQSGLWIFEDTGTAPSFTSQWLRDGVALSEETGNSYTTQAADEGSSIALEETATGTHGTRSAQSAAVIVAPPLELTLSDGSVEIIAGPTQLDITLTGTSHFDGTYTVDTADLEMGPVNLVRPALIGVGTVGTSIQVRAGLWAYEDLGTAPVISYQWYRDAAAISGETGQTYTVQNLDEGSSLSVIETASDGHGSVMSQTPGLAVAPATPALDVTRVGGFQSSGAATNSPSFTLDLSPYDADDQIVVFYGPSVYATSSTLAGQSGTKITTDGANNGASRMAAFVHTLSAAGSATAPLEIGLPSSTNHHVIGVHAIRGGTISDVVLVRNTSGDTQSLSVTPTHANNTILACAMGVSFMDAVFNWTGVAEIETANMPTASSRNISVAMQSNVAIAPHTVTGTPSGTSHTGIVALAISEA